MSQSLKFLEQQFHRIAQLDHAITFLSWDQMVMMPSDGSQPRASALAELSTMRHELLASDAIGDSLEKAVDELANGEISAANQSHVTEMQRAWQKARTLPAKLVHAQVLAGSKCEHGWRSQKAVNDWDGFLKNFQPVVELSREEAQCRQAQRPDDFATPYDAMLDLHCAGDSQALIGKVFSELKQALPEVLQQVMDKQSTRTAPCLSGDYPVDQQQKLSEHLMSLLGFDFAGGRLDVSLHPFSTGVRGDQRITTRYRTIDFADALQATAHETGHASYESGLPEKWQSYPVGMARNMCIHESQSLFFEKQICLSRAFGKSFLTAIHEYLPATRGFSADDIWIAQTVVKPSYIRVEADEVTYPLHVMLRYDIESALINGEIEPRMIPDLWETLLQEYLGLSTVGDHGKGCLQDIHWTDGSFGYFPSYTMGAVNAAQIAATVKARFPDWRDQFTRGKLEFVRTWLHDTIWQQGSQQESQALMEQATGQGSSAQFLLDHLKGRYLLELD
ncbi:MAG: carboxypeptidase M32 [Granulosicoccus sp.]